MAVATPTPLTFEITVTYEIAATSEVEAHRIWEDDGPETGVGVDMSEAPRWTKLPNAIDAARDRRKRRVADHLRAIARGGRHPGAARLAADLLHGEPCGRYCVSGLGGHDSMTFYTDDLEDAEARASAWADRVDTGLVVTRITDLDA
ncbi:MAG TPA: hypothetical protein PKB03_00040 [Baekduia sp.]|nr:hypothetical protein [Baekduia sp.]